MGDYSRDPGERLEDSYKKHYVSVRMQQGRPVVEVDLNLSEDLRRQEMEELGKWIIGNGVPEGNDGFLIMSIDNGGLNAIVIRSNFAGIGLSSLCLD